MTTATARHEYVLHHKPKGGRWHAVGTYATSLDAICAMKGSGKFRVEERQPEAKPARVKLEFRDGDRWLFAASIAPAAGEAFLKRCKRPELWRLTQSK